MEQNKKDLKKNLNPKVIELSEDLVPQKEDFIIKEKSNYSIQKNKSLIKSKRSKNYVGGAAESSNKKSQLNYETFITIEESQEQKPFEKDYSKQIENLDISQIAKRNETIQRNYNKHNSSLINTSLQSNFSEQFLTESNLNQITSVSVQKQQKPKKKPPAFLDKLSKKIHEKSVEKEYIINNIETIYGQLEKTTPTISFLLLILFLISIINFSAFWSLGYLISDLKTTFYCFDLQSGEFLICESIDFCKSFKKGIPNMIFLDEPKISNITVEYEKQNINKFFRSLAMYDLVRFSAWNRLKDRKTIKTMNSYQMVIGVNKNENFNLFSKYNLVCNYQTTMMHMGLTFLFGLVVFGILFGCFADIIGRKRILSLLILIQIFGFVVLFGFDFLLEQKIDFSENVKIEIDSNNVFQHMLWAKQGDENYDAFLNNPYNNKTIIDNNTFIINETYVYDTKEIYVEKYVYDPAKFEDQEPLSAEIYLQTDKVDFLTSRENKFNFNISQFDEVFQKKFFYMEKAKKKTFTRRQFFFENRAIFMLGFNLAFSTMPAIFSLCLVYFMELSLNVSSTISNYKFLTKSYIIAYVVSYYLSVFVNSYALVLLVYACLQLILFVIFHSLSIESPRFCYEVSDWIQLTDIIKTKFLDDREAELNEKILEKIVRSKDDPIFKQEIKHEKSLMRRSRWEQFQMNLDMRILTFNLFRDHSVIERKINNELKSKIEFKNFIKYPFLMYTLIYRSKHYKDISILIYSMVFNLAIVICIIQSKFNNEIFLSREVLYGKDHINFTVLLNFAMMLISNYVFLFLDEIWGYPIIMSLCYFFIFILSLLYGLENINNLITNYMKNNNFLISIEYANKIQNLFFRRLTLFNSFFIHGVYFPLFLYLMNHSRTVSRATYFGIFNLIFYTLYMISIALAKYFETSYLFICICCLVGFLISYFVKKSDNERIVKDFRILEKRNN